MGAVRWGQWAGRSGVVGEVAGGGGGGVREERKQSGTNSAPTENGWAREWGGGEKVWVGRI